MLIHFLRATAEILARRGPLELATQRDFSGDIARPARPGALTRTPARISPGYAAIMARVEDPPWRSGKNPGTEETTLGQSAGDANDSQRGQDANAAANTGATTVTAPVEATTAATTPLTGVPVAADARDSDEPGQGPGSRIGRYLVLERLGAGAMGIVLAAFDPELDRKVAIKLLRAQRSDVSLSESSDAQARLLREAQALARLSHPNVVGIFDAGEHEGQVWIAMELVQGRTLRAWLAERPRGWTEVVEVMTDVGRGLAAAHAVGLVHRDVKPDNIMLGDDGRARVMDFGLARRGAELPESPLDASARRAMLTVDVTVVGTMIGTPAYMAPEQFRGEFVGPQVDVFAFSVTLWEALYGARPFAGASIPELRACVEAGRIVAPNGRKGVPRWLNAVALRGVAVSPTRRWPSMNALLDALREGRARTRRRRAALAACGLAAVLGGAYGGSVVARQRAVAACEAEGAAVREDWSEAAQERALAALTATGKPNAATVFQKTAPWLDRWASSWQAVRTEVCVRHDVDGTLSDELLERARDCLDELRGGFAATIHGLEDADESALARATAAAAGLTRAESCADEGALRQRPPLSPERRDEVATVRERLGQAYRMQVAGKFKEGLEAARAAKEAALLADSRPALAEAERRIGTLESHLGDYPAAEASLLRALTAAREARTPRPATEAITGLVFVVGDRGARFAEGKVWAEAARLELTHVAGDVRPLEAQLDHNLALVYHGKGEYEEAQRLNERALSVWIELYGEEHPQVAQSLNNLANTFPPRDRYEEAIPLHERALAIRERTLGSDHPFVASSLSNVASAHLARGRAAEARRFHERALEIRERVLGPTHPDRIESLNNLANVYLSIGEFDTALELYARALAALEGAPGGNPRVTATILYNCALIYYNQGHDAEAVRDHTRSLSILEEVLGKEHSMLGFPLDGLAHTQLRRGELVEARRLFERSLAIREAAFGKDSPPLGASLFGLAAVARARGDLDEALRLGTRALALAERGADNEILLSVLGELADVESARGRPQEAAPLLERALTLVPPGERHRTPPLRFQLARALWDANSDRPRARLLALQAAEAFAADAGREKEAAEVRAWLENHTL